MTATAAAGEFWPDSITATVGELQVRLEKRSFWTLYRIDYRNERLGIDQWGSHYGSVAKFPGVGFIGSGHTENEDEVVESIRLWIDGSEIGQPPESVECETLRFEKTARLRTLTLKSTVEVRDNRLYESVTLTAQAPTDVSLVYHFMHPWTTDMQYYRASMPDGRIIAGKFNDDKGFKIDQPARWTAVYDPVRAMGAVTYVLQAPEDNWTTRYWDVPERYRKHYFTTFQNQTIPAEASFSYRIATVPFAAPEEEWEGAASQVAAQCEKELHHGADSD